MSDHEFAGDEELLRHLLAEEEKRDHVDLPESIDFDDAEELRRVINRLDSAHRFEQRSLADARVVQNAPGEDRVAATLEELASDHTTGITAGEPAADGLNPTPLIPTAPWHRAIPMLAAAAIFSIAVVLGQFNPGPDSSETPQLMGGGALSIVRPAGPGSDFGHFEWTSEFPADHWYVVTVYPGDIDVPMKDDQLSQSDHLRETSWSLSANTAATWPDHIYWEVSAFDSSGGSVTFAFAEASR